jgi:hypothetical protein
LPALLELLKKSSPLSNQEVPDKKTLNSFNDLFYLTADGKTLAQPQLMIGSARSREIIINIGLPIRHIFVRRKIQRAGNRTARPFSDWQEHQRSQATSIYQTLYFWPLGGNAPGPLHSEKQKQGLMQVYQDFCTQNENNCRHCTFPGVVNSFFSLKNLKNASIPLRNHSISPKIDIPLDCIEHSR